MYVPKIIECENLWSKHDGEIGLKWLNGLVYFEEDVFKAWINRGYMSCIGKSFDDDNISVKVPFSDIDTEHVLREYSTKSVFKLILKSINEEL